VIALKRAIDLAIASTALVVGAPLILFAGAAIKLETRGPIIFRQRRVGQGYAPIETLKLRTMRTSTSAEAPQITASGDHRVTRVGRFLRKTKLDELPQLWNVVRGDMSIVGPRPEVPRYVETYRPEWKPLFSVRPGLTDLASITFRDEEALLACAYDRDRAYREVVMPLKLGLALEGVKQSSISYDFGVLLRTVTALFNPPTPEANSTLAEAHRRIELLNASST
jgi:lipopolysaccharide/colanic/teichoic acid biosynthesis glycosyltransferase